MLRTRVKICGITRVQDATAVVQSGADALGLVFYPESPRHVTLEQARKIAAGVAPFVTVTGLFVDAATSAVQEVLASVPLGLLQFHGQETNDQCNCFGLPFIKSIPMKSGTDLSSLLSAYPDAAGFLLDAWQPETHGGGGIAFDWQQVPEGIQAPLVLAGGLTPGNVATAIRTVKPYAVDVSSGVERDKGIKSRKKIEAFMKEVRNSET
ncbi:MAG: phosphoribosylanthranilate isomerase [Gammaproteobacteria bacterium]|jgi:phosphoribosylanthranilate isomerase